MASKITPNDVMQAWKSIDRTLKTVTTDTEISGIPNPALTPDEFAAYLIPDDNLNALGGVGARHIAKAQDVWDREKVDKIKRYNKLDAAQEHPEIDGILNIYADEATTEDSEGIILHTSHPDANIQEVVEDLWDRIGIDEKSWKIIRNMCGAGDEYYEIVIARSGRSILKIEMHYRALAQHPLLGEKQYNTQEKNRQSQSHSQHQEFF